MISYRKALFSIALLASQLASAAVSPDTIVWLNRAKKPVVDFLKGEHVIATDYGNYVIGEVDKVYIGKVKSCIELTFEDGTNLKVSPEQQVYVPSVAQWASATLVRPGDALWSMTGPLYVKCVTKYEYDEPMYSVEVNNYHNYFAGENGVLLHNGPIAGAVTYWGIKLGAYLGAGAVVGGATVVASGAVVVSAPVSGAATIVAAGTSIACPAATVAGAAAGVAGTAAGGGATAALAATASVQVMAAGTAAVAAIETTAATAGFWALSCPFLP